jgi:S1-C subfamily serine protease
MAVCAVSLAPAVATGQNRTQSRDSYRQALSPLVNLYTEQRSRTGLGLYLDAGQSRRFDRDGALITGVMRDSPAQEAGLRNGDVITVFEGQVLTIPLPDGDRERDFDLDRSLPAQRLLALAGDLEPGQTVEIRYLRDGANNTVSVEAEDFEIPEVRVFGAGPGGVFGVVPEGGVYPFQLDHDLNIDLTAQMHELQDRLGDMDVDVSGMVEGARGWFGAPGQYTWGFGRTAAQGVELIDLNPELGEYFGSDTGVLVVEVDEESTLGLMAGDVVLAVGGREADTAGRVLRLIRTYEEDEPIRFRVIRRGSELTTEGFIE